LREDTLARCRRVLGNDHPETLRSVQDFTRALRHSGDYERARELDEDTLGRYRRLFGDDHPHTLDAADTLAYDLDVLGRHAEADSLREQFVKPADPRSLG
jgi:ornithine cyclodeaminase/alanine dehydrogenase-like protein (mu-crystallin family)